MGIYHMLTGRSPKVVSGATTARIDFNSASPEPVRDDLTVQALDSFHGPLMIADADNVIIRVNDAMKTMLSKQGCHQHG